MSEEGADETSTFDTFEGESYRDVAVYVVGATLIWIVVYLATVTLLGWTERITVQTNAGFGARSFGAGVAMAASMIYFIILYFYERGGPRMNLLWPFLITFLMPPIVYAGFQPNNLGWIPFAPDDNSYFWSYNEMKNIGMIMTIGIIGSAIAVRFIHFFAPDEWVEEHMEDSSD